MPTQKSALTLPAMFVAIFTGAMLLMTLYCAFMVVGAWRNPENWHIDGETKEVVFHSWLDIGIFCTIGAVCALVALLGLIF
ncbi:hypothetical protein [Erythrobacter sp. Alg231-14]|uniref:hypothetical protein n=1 Tax=Erythrobacter sp. Alg231-14 TaxID=1922225 RepID=UPI00307C8FE0